MAGRKRKDETENTDFGPETTERGASVATAEPDPDDSLPTNTGAGAAAEVERTRQPLPAVHGIGNGTRQSEEGANKPRRPRDPNAVRPFYLLMGTDRATGATVLVGREPTIGKARKALPGVAAGVRLYVDNVRVFRVKEV